MSPKNPTKLYPLILTNQLETTKQFYEKAGFRVVFDQPAYLHLAYGEGDGPELAFMTPDGFPDGKVRPVFDGRGVFLSIPTPNADEKFAQLKALGVELLTPVDDKPWGWRSFLALDPNGLVLDFFHVFRDTPM